MWFNEKDELSKKQIQKKIIDEKIQNKDIRLTASFNKKNSTFLEKVIKWRYIVFNVLFSHTFSRNKYQMIFSLLYISLIAIFSFVCVVPLVTNLSNTLRKDFFPYYYFLIVIFAFDWLFRLSFTDIVIKKSEKKFKRFFLYQFSILAIIDLLTWLLPFIFFLIPQIDTYTYAPMVLIIKSLTAFRLLYLFNKVGSIQTLFAVVKKSVKQLLIVIGIMLVFVFLFSLILYNVEIDSSNQANTKIKEWFDAFWMCFITITTIGYGDVYPTSDVGKLLTMILAILGISFYSFLTSVIVNAFSRYLDELRRKRELKNLENSQKILKEYKNEIDSKLKKLNITEIKEDKKINDLTRKIYNDKSSKSKVFMKSENPKKIKKNNT